MKLARLAWILLAWACLPTSSAWACRYNVRDVGFVDLGTEPGYRLYAFFGRSTPAEVVSALRELSGLAVQASNLAVDVVNADEQKDHAGLKYLSPEAARALPAAVLVSPDGQSLPLALFNRGASLREGMATALRELISSPTRDALVEAISDAFAAVLLIEGQDAAANSRARQAVAAAMEEIHSQMKLMPKAIARPPLLVRLEAASLEREKILLWSLGLDTKRTEQPRAAVLYGRARWIGPLVKGDEITAHNLAGLLSILGADCECGLDISWTQGTRMLVRWGEERHAQLTKALGFDPESPMVKLEVSRILGRRGSAPPAQMGYQEVSLEPVAAGPSEARSTARPSTSDPDKAQAQGRSPRARSIELAEGSPVLGTSLLAVGGLAIFVFAAGLFILLRSRKPKTE